MTLTVDVHHHMLPDFFWQATNEDPLIYLRCLPQIAVIRAR